MVNLPPGSANPVAPNVYATWIFTPNPNSGSINSVSIWNTGTNTVYIGGAGVNQADSFPLAPGNRPLRLQNIGATLYAVAGVNVGAVIGTLSTSYTAGTATIVTAATLASAYTAPGAILVLGSQYNPGWEVVVSQTIGTGRTTVGTTSLVSDHGAVPIYTATALPASIVVQAGVL